MDETIHESPASIILRHQSTRGMLTIGKVKLGFHEKTVVVEAIQGVENLFNVKQANQELGESWSLTLMRATAQHARKSGYSHVFIRDPTTLYWYNNPKTGYERGSAKHEDAAEKIQHRIVKFYTNVAMKLGYTKTDGGFIKEV